MLITEICVQTFSSIHFIKEQLEFNGFSFKNHQLQLDNYYTHFSPEKVETLPYAILMNNAILLRTIRSDKEKHLIMYKNKTINSKNEVIKEEKIESRLDNMDQTKRVFMLSGMNNWVSLDVEEWEFVKDNITITIQNVAGLGVFLEIEEPVPNANIYETKFRELTFLANSFGLDLGKDYSVKKNYLLYKKLLGRL